MLRVNGVVRGDPNTNYKLLINNSLSDVSCLRRSPRIRLKGDEEEGRKDTVVSVFGEF